ncbi:type II toxin-antitoxin system RelE/ParE family toxin [Dyadobacter sp. CY347]|uniref:type II toxin-antitoxin system RelE family toxin n=1 Tax=Dyadobacter sp. CY347 TaxID=2909336 RepID=UPI001F403660|nr:type II toxin-antitoxin system RelE/ParE family toxin [Dyadobacter sp. CY347]MCF2487133.1 type II toxin-antitoxin system RelE/ParE family toxin [Dyadobacter sp. CY347]
MKVEFLRKFSKDLDNLEKPAVKLALMKLIKSVEDADSLKDIPHTKKLKGFTNAYRIRIGDYRVGIFVENDVVELARIAHRKDIYNVFP